jgi:hypothetical protein
MVIERQKKIGFLAANSESPDARDQALSFDTLGGLIQQGVTVVFRMVIERRKKFGFSSK